VDVAELAVLVVGPGLVDVLPALSEPPSSAWPSSSGAQATSSVTTNIR
jgi:hypothetical protein